MKNYMIYTTKGQCTNLQLQAESEEIAVLKAKKHFKNGVLSFSNKRNAKLHKDKFYAKELA